MSASRPTGRLLLSLIKEGKKEEASTILRTYRERLDAQPIKERAFVAGYYGDLTAPYGKYEPESFNAGIEFAKMARIKK